MQSVAVIDYGASNLRSVVKALEHIASEKHEIQICNTPEAIVSADRIIFPGQGAIRQCMDSLDDIGLRQALLESLSSKPFLGLCLGLQALMDYSEEDNGTTGLGVISGKVMRFPSGQKQANGDEYKIPHMGWNNVQQVHDHPLWNGIKSGERFYFVHSYYVQADDKDVITGMTDYIVKFTCAVSKDNLFAVQFHPEKSQRAGLQLLSNFLVWN
jgi:glutamine amidotransferase